VDENVTEHDPLVSVQLVVVPKVPRLAVHETVPVGVVPVPGDESATVALQLLVWLVVIVDGVHTTVVLVVRLMTFTIAFEPATLVTCIVSPG